MLLCTQLPSTLMVCKLQVLILIHYHMLLGHSDVLMGVVCTSNAGFAKRMKFLQMSNYTIIVYII